MNYKNEVKFYFLNQDIGDTLTGVESASLLRARLFKKNLHISPIIVTAAFNPRLNIQRKKLYENGLLDKDSKIINLYEYFQGITYTNQLPYNESYKANSRWRYKPVENTHDYRIFDENNKLIAYRKCDDNAILMYNNIFLDQKKVRRDVYDSRGFLSKTQHLNHETGQVFFESYYRTDGSICIYKYFKLKNNNNDVDTIHLINTKGDIINVFETETDLLAYWMQQLLDNNLHNFLIIDKERVYYPALQKMNQSNISKICMIHSSHLQKDQDILQGRLNSNYRRILEDLAKPNAVVFLTNRQKQHVEERFGLYDNLFTIPHPIEEQPEVDFEIRVPRKAIYLARYSEEKQHDSLIRVFQKVVRAYPDATLDLYGHGEKREAILGQIRELGLENNIFVNGYVMNVNNLYDTTSLSILPSKVEGISLFLLESIAHGCPIVSYNINYGPEDIVDDGINGYLIEPQKEEEMADRIIALFGDTEKLKEMSRAAYKKAESFQAESIAERWLELIERVLQRKWINQATMDRADSYLSIPTYDGSGQCVHPSVKFFPEKWNGYNYWMAMTPYADTRDDLENASVVVSNDGENWIVPEGLSNPIVAQPSIGYNSDPNLYFENGILYLINRHVNLIDKLERIFMYSTTDGIHWSDPIEIIKSEISNERMLSPCLIKLNDIYALYTIDIVPSPNQLKMRVCSTLTGEWSEPRTISDITVSGSDVWHFEIIKHQNYYLMLLQECLLNNGGGHRGQLHLGLSRDGLHWNLSDTFFRRMYDSTWDQNIYKSSLQPSLYDEDAFDVWYSANNGEGQWRIGKSVIRFNKDLLISKIKNEERKNNLFLDTFHRADGPLGDGWITSGTFCVMGNFARAAKSANNKAITDVGVPDYEVTARFEKYISGEQYLIVRASDINNFIRCGRTTDGYFVAQNVKNGSGSAIFIKCDYTPLDGDYLTVRCAGSIFSIYINGILLIKGFSDFNQAATHIGMQCPNPNNFFGAISVKAIK